MEEIRVKQEVFQSSWRGLSKENNDVRKRVTRQRARRAGKIGGALASPRPWKCQSLRRGHRRVLGEVATFAVSAIPPPSSSPPPARGPINLSTKLWCIPNQFTGLLVIKFANIPPSSRYIDINCLSLARSFAYSYNGDENLQRMRPGEKDTLELNCAKRRRQRIRDTRHLLDLK